MKGTAEDYVPVLLYHSVTASSTVDDHWQVTVADFKEDMAAVAATGRPVVTASVYAAWLRHELRLPTPPVLVTFDDGFADFADLALPILESHGLCATLFVTTGWIGRDRMLRRAAIRDLADTTTEIGAHSVNHPHLYTLDTRRATQELEVSRAQLAELTNRPVTSFAYPHGSHHEGIKELVRRNGYVTAHAVKNAISHGADDPFAVARYTVTSQTTRRQVSEVLAGHGAPRSWQGERMRTRALRLARRMHSVAVGRP